ncbi:sensor histidine kinase [Tamaricihabitans halophyticus]|nr:histidine kinase [Tamaricihabitans halophyticus]
MPSFRVFQRRIHVVPVRFLGLGYTLGTVAMAYGPGPAPAPADWAVGSAAGLLVLAGGTLPLLVTCAQAGILALSIQLQLSVEPAMPLVAMFALLELAMRRKGWQVVVGVAVLLVARLSAVTRLASSGSEKDTSGNNGEILENVAPNLLYLLFAGLVPVVIALLLGVYLRSIRKLMRMYDEQRREIERLRESEMRAARGAERTAIARELHDIVAHHIASIVLRVGVARHVGRTDQAMTKVLDDVYETGNAALGDLRELVAVLRDPASVDPDPDAPLLEPGDLPSALHAVVGRIEQAGLAVRASIDGELDRLDAMRRLAVLRVVQEGLTNSLKHADGVTRAELDVGLFDNGEVRIEVRDDGLGSRVGGPVTGGHGLLGLAERIERIGGHLTAGPTGHGFRLLAVLPRPSARLEAPTGRSAASES